MDEVLNQSLACKLTSAELRSRKDSVIAGLKKKILYCPG
jgi:hypothetical protein